MVSSFIGQMLSNAIKKPSYLFTILTITFGFNLYLVKFHGFTILELQDNFTKIRYIEFLYIIIAYSFSQTFLVHLYYLLEAIISDLKAPSYIDKDPSRPTISYHGLKRIALYQSNYAAYRMYKDEKNKIQEYDNRLVASFFFLLSAILDTIISLSQSIIASIYNSPYQHLIGIALGLVVINAIATIKDFDQKRKHVKFK